MTRDDIIRMAREAWGLHCIPDSDVPKLKRFAALVAAAEREACLAILRDMEGKKWHTVIHGGEMKGVSLHDAYTVIRARSNSENL